MGDEKSETEEGRGTEMQSVLTKFLHTPSPAVFFSFLRDVQGCFVTWEIPLLFYLLFVFALSP